MSEELSDIGLYGLAVMGQNLALNIGSRNVKISVCNRSNAKVDTCVARAKKEDVPTLKGFYDADIKKFVESIRKPRAIILLVKAGKPVEAVIEKLVPLLEKGDMIIDGGNEWYENTERRAKEVGEKGILYMGMGVSGGEDGARFGPSMMPGGPKECYERVQKILEAAAAKSEDGTICVKYIGPGGSGNYVKMIHNGIEYGDMQLIAEAYDLLQKCAGLTNPELAKVFEEWNKGELKSFLIEITADIFKVKDTREERKEEYLVDNVLDQTGSKGTGKWTCQEAAERGIGCPTINAALNARYMSALKEERMIASKKLKGPKATLVKDKEKFIDDVKKALYASKICSYAQGMNIIKEMSKEKSWDLNLGEIASIWKAGCIIRAVFLDRITAAYVKNKELANLLLDPEFQKDVESSLDAWRRVVVTGVQNGVPCPALADSLAYYDTYRREKLPANLTQAQRDYFGAHTFKYMQDGPSGESTHAEWSKLAKL